ncbi:C-type lectin domain family 2 member E-like isoform X1 [Pipra filicauda]|uniref:C-type lectin domain family 2 member E-like isoform X1 n=1 Tax=Pipra filicauda TaxID=649802 RepID=A0A7R5L525_9PASS|nr:C-type lectin domain family 2 member E-like isoform X1 [Pipra filicauda]
MHPPHRAQGMSALGPETSVPRWGRESKSQILQSRKKHCTPTAIQRNSANGAFLLRYKGEANHWIGLGMRDNGWEWINGTALNGRFEVRGEGPCGYLYYWWISSSLCHTEKNWICSRPDNFVLWEGKLRDPKLGLST